MARFGGLGAAMLLLLAGMPGVTMAKRVVVRKVPQATNGVVPGEVNDLLTAPTTDDDDVLTADDDDKADAEPKAAVGESPSRPLLQRDEKTLENDDDGEAAGDSPSKFKDAVGKMKRAAGEAGRKMKRAAGEAGSKMGRAASKAKSWSAGKFGKTKSWFAGKLGKK